MVFAYWLPWKQDHQKRPKEGVPELLMVKHSSSPLQYIKMLAAVILYFQVS